MGDGRGCLRWLLRITPLIVLVASRPQTTRAETIVLLGPTTPVAQGSTVTVIALLADNTTNLVSYSLDVDVLPAAGSAGSVTGLGEPASNFFEVRNLIERDPDDSLDPLFSLIAPSADGGVFLNALSASGTPVDLAIPGVSDALGQIVFEVSADALGTYQISLGPGSDLFDGAGDVAFDSNVVTIDVVPEPTALGLLSCGFLLMVRSVGRRRVSNRCRTVQ